MRDERERRRGGGKACFGLLKGSLGSPLAVCCARVGSMPHEQADFPQPRCSAPSMAMKLMSMSAAFEAFAPLLPFLQNTSDIDIIFYCASTNSVIRLAAPLTARSRTSLLQVQCADSSQRMVSPTARHATRLRSSVLERCMHRPCSCLAFLSTNFWGGGRKGGSSNAVPCF